MDKPKLTIKESILVNRNVGEAIRLLRKRISDISLPYPMASIEDLENDYKLMRSSFSSGLCDPNGEAVYDSLLRRAYRIYLDVRLQSIVKRRIEFLHCANIAARFDIGGDAVCSELEDYVQETAMLSLSVNGEKLQTVDNVNAAHQKYMSNLFCSLLVSKQWNTANKTAYCDMLTSPLVDRNDALLIISALTMALLNVFDLNKWLTLVFTYLNSSVESVKQRALVGVMLTLPNEEQNLFPEIHKAIESICKHDNACREIVELQLQLLLSMQTEEDNDEIQRDIMPTLIKNNNYKITNNRIVEIDDDPLKNILDSDSADKNVAELEEKMKKMMAMKESGSDIYFGGFSHMKRFSFFYQLCNWFAPFSFDHPDVASVLKGKNGEMIRKILSNGPFCNSDKYSFVFALSAVIDKLPPEIKEVVSSGKGIADVVSSVDADSAPYIRRMYLQDLYRFFKLYPARNDFANPFEKTDSANPAFFVSNGLLDGLLRGRYFSIGHHLIKSKKYHLWVDLVSRLMKEGIATGDEKYLCVLAYRRLGKNNEAYELLQELQFSGYDKLRVDKGLADVLFALGKYGEAADYYNKVMQTEPNDRHCMLYRSLSLVNSGNVKDGLTDLFRIDYEDGNDIDVKRIIAWGYLVDCKPKEAERIYDGIIASAKAVATDWLNCGYTKVVLSKITAGLDCFRTYLKQDAATGGVRSLKTEFGSDRAVLAKNGVKDYQLRLILDILETDIVG